jgi:hypothetical protein
LKKFFVGLLIFILLCAVSCTTTKSSLGTQVVYDETQVVTNDVEVVGETLTDLVEDEVQAEEAAEATETVDVAESSDATETVESVDTVEATEAGELVESVESPVEETASAKDSEDVGYVAEEVTSAETTEIAEVSEVSEVAEMAESEASEVELGAEVVSSEEPSSEVTEVVESASEAEVEQPVESSEAETVITETPAVEEANEVESSKEVVLTNEASEPVPTAFFDKVVYYAKLYGNIALEFAKANILFSLGLLTMAIGIIMLIVDLIKYIVKSIKSNKYEEEMEIEEPDIDRNDLYHPLSSTKKQASDFDSDEVVYAEPAEPEDTSSKVETSPSTSVKYSKKDYDDDKKFQTDDDFLRSLLNDEDL